MKKVSLMLSLQIIICSIFAADDNLFDNNNNSDNGFKITVENVGQGNGIRIYDNKNGSILFVDAGSSQNSGNKNQEDMATALTSNLSHKLAIVPITIVVSHPDKDHLNLFNKMLDSPLLQSNKNITVYLGGSFEKYLTSDDARKLLDKLIKLEDSAITTQKTYSLSHALSKSEMKQLYDSYTPTKERFKDSYLGYLDISSAIAQTLRKQMENKVRPFILGSIIENIFNDTSQNSRAKVEIMCANAGHTPTWNSSASFVNDNTCTGGEVVNPDDNTNSIVLRIRFYDRTAIAITGDATGITTDRLINHSSSNLECDVVIACHHGSITEESNNQRWVEATNPKYVIFSAGKHDGYHHPQFDAIWNYACSSRITSVVRHNILCAKQHLSAADKKAALAEVINLENSNNNGHWLDATTTKALYSTHSSGTINIQVKSDGTLAFSSQEVSKTPSKIAGITH